MTIDHFRFLLIYLPWGQQFTPRQLNSNETESIESHSELSAEKEDKEELFALGNYKTINNFNHKQYPFQENK